MAKPALVCFDLDDTLIRDVHSVMLLCILNGRLEPLLEIEKRECSGEIDWISADYLKAHAFECRQLHISEQINRLSAYTGANGVLRRGAFFAFQNAERNGLIYGTGTAYI